MAKDWASDVKKFAPDADDSVIAGIVRYCGIALQKPDSSLVSYTDPVELGRVRNNFLKKKLALTDPDDVLDAAIAAVGERMKGVNFKNRVTVYYLLLDHLNLLDRFRKPGVAVKAAPAAESAAAPDSETSAAPVAALAAAGAATAGAVAASGTDTVAPASEAVVDAGDAAAGAVTDSASAALETVSHGAAALAAAGAGAATMAASGLGAAASAPRAMLGSGFATDDGEGKGGYGFLLWAVVGGLMLLVLALLFWLFTNYNRPVAPVTASAAQVLNGGGAAPAPTTPVEPATPALAAPVAAAPIAVPDGAGIVSETREAKPVVKVYFDTGKALVAPSFALATEPLKAWLTANPASKLAVSGYNDPTGNAAANAALSKRRAQAVQAALVAAGVPAASIELVKPEAATDTGTTAAEARRVEVYVK